MNDLTTDISPFTVVKKSSLRPNCLFEVEPYRRASGKTLADVRDDLRLKKALKRAVENDVAPIRLIASIRAGFRS